MRGSLSLPSCSRAARLMSSDCARHIGAASERENVYSSSGTSNSTVAVLARGDSLLSEMAMIGTLVAAALR